VLERTVTVAEDDEDARRMVAFVATRDRRLFEQLFERHRRAMVAHAGRYVRDAARAEELAQEVFVRVYRTRSYEPTARFKTWLYRVATNVCLNELRRPEHRQRHESLEARMETKADPTALDSPLTPRGGSPEETTASAQLARRLDAALGALPENQRAAFLMARHDGLTHEEIAEVLSTTVPAVKSLIHRALEALRREVERVGGEAGARPAEVRR
jgi:RNA polymerase sigma-70 factor (ECF subfamily)